MCIILKVMPKDIKKTKKNLNEVARVGKATRGKKDEESVDIVEVELEEDENAVAEELDPEIAAVLTAGKKKSKKLLHDVDYIPEFERGDIDMDSSLPSEDF
jgi:hypothetical protein